MINAGVSFAINENFFNKLLTDLLPNVLKLIGDEFNTTKVYELDLDMITLFISKPSLIINTINYDPDLTKANLYHENNSVGFHIVDSKVNLTLDYDVFTDPLLIDDIGKVDVGYEKLNLDITFGMGASKDDPNQFAIEVSQSSLSVDPKSVRIDLTNENDFNKLVVSVVNAILPPIANLVGTALSEYLQNLVDLVTGLVKWPLVIKDISVDLSFKEWPVVTNDTYLTISSVGKISLAEKDHPFVNTALLPQWVPDGKDFQVFISDYTIRSALATISQIDMDPLTITKKDTKIMSTSYLNSFFPGLSKEFGKNKDCKLDIRLSSDPLPELSITPKGIDTSTSVLMSLS